MILLTWIVAAIVWTLGFFFAKQRRFRLRLPLAVTYFAVIFRAAAVKDGEKRPPNIYFRSGHHFMGSTLY